LDEFSGTRGPLDENGENRLVSGALYLHGRHIFNALLRDLVAKFGLDRSTSVVLIGTGKLKYIHNTEKFFRMVIKKA
jgi:hypothetical protein